MFQIAETMYSVIMKNSILVLLVATSVFSTPRAFAESRPECKEWREKVLNIFDQDATHKNEKLELKKNTKIKDLVELIKNYPNDIGYRVPRIQKTDNPETAINEAMSVKGCEEILYFDVFKASMKDKSNPIWIRQEIAKALRDRIVKNDDAGATVITLLVELTMLETAIDEKALKVSDELYLKVGSLMTNAKSLKERVAEENSNLNWGCEEKHTCSKQDYFNVYQHLYEENKGARSIYQELVWLAKRL